VVAWMSDGDLVHRDGLWREDRWRERLGRSRHVRPLLAGAAAGALLMVRSAATHRLDRAAGDGWLAVGDAACAFDPLASAGIVMALRSGLEAAEALGRHLAGDRAALGEFDERLGLRFAEYRRGRRDLYRQEARWPESPFWRRRREDPESPRPEREARLHPPTAATAPAPTPAHGGR